MNVIRSVGDEWIENGHYAYQIGCERRCGCQGRVLLLGRVKNPRLKHVYDNAPGIPIEATHRVIWDEESTEFQEAIFASHPSQ